MEKTTVMFTVGLKRRAIKRASEEGISLGELVRRAVEALLNGNKESGSDPFLDDLRVFEGETATDIAANHDHYLYGSKR